MKYTMLATALALALGGTALAGPDPQPAQDPDQPAAGAAPSATSETPAETPSQTPSQQPQQPQQPQQQSTSSSTTSLTGTPQTEGNDTAEAEAEQRAKSLGSVDLLFDFDSANLKTGARTDLVTLARWAKCNAKGAVVLEGHTDVIGSQDYNMKLAGERAGAVREKLIAMGVPSDRIVVTVYGKNGPRRGSQAEDRRVTVRAIATPVQPGDITAQR